MSDWEASDNESPVRAPSAPVKPTLRKKWEGEDEERDKSVASDWEESEDEEEQKKTAPATVPVAPPSKKKGSVKQKIEEKEALKAMKPAANGDDVYDEDEVLDPREKLQQDKEKELKADLANATDLFGGAALGGTSDNEVDKIISMDPRTKEDFQDLSRRIIDYIIKRHQNKPLYHYFVEYHVRELSMPLNDAEVRKAASGLTILANEKQREQREKASGKKKSKASGKSTISSVKAANKLDTNIYDEVLDDFGRDPDDFM